AWRMFRTSLEGVAALGRASGVALPANIVETLVKQGEALPPALMASLGNDLMQERRLELEALHGHAVRLGERLGIATPAVSAVYAALKPHVDGRPHASDARRGRRGGGDRKSTRLNSSHQIISYAVFCFNIKL